MVLCKTNLSFAIILKRKAFKLAESYFSISIFLSYYIVIGVNPLRDPIHSEIQIALSLSNILIKLKKMNGE